MAEPRKWRFRPAGHRADETGDVQSVPVDASAGGGSIRAAARRWLVVGLAAAGLIGLGVVIGWFALTRLVASGSPEPEVVQVPIAEYLDAGGGKATMPDVRGLSADAARAVLSDAGIPTGDVQVEDVPSALPLGVVAEQSPAFGTTPVDAVVLSVASKALVPDLVEEAEADAQSALVALGARVVVERQYAAGSTAGLVLSTTPKAGATLPESVTLVVSEAPGSAYLSQLDTVDGSSSCSDAQALLNGQEFANSLACNVTEDGEEYVWLLGKKVTTFQATIGVPDDGDRQTKVAVTLLADGRRVGGGTVGFGQPISIDVSVLGALQLQLSARSTVPSDSFSSDDVVLGDARLVGDKDDLAVLAGWADR